MDMPSPLYAHVRIWNIAAISDMWAARAGKLSPARFCINGNNKQVGGC